MQTEKHDISQVSENICHTLQAEPKIIEEIEIEELSIDGICGVY